MEGAGPPSRRWGDLPPHPPKWDGDPRNTFLSRHHPVTVTPVTQLCARLRPLPSPLLPSLIAMTSSRSAKQQLEEGFWALERFSLSSLALSSGVSSDRSHVERRRRRSRKRAFRREAPASLNVNIYYLCTDRNTSEAPYWLGTWVNAYVWHWFWCFFSILFFLCRDVVERNFKKKAEKKVGREPMAPPTTLQPSEEDEYQELLK